MHFAKKENYELFKETVLNQVKFKIKEIPTMTEGEKLSSVNNYAINKLRTLENQALMKKNEAPIEGSEAHVLSEAQWLEEMQDRVNFASDVRNQRSINSFIIGYLDHIYNSMIGQREQIEEELDRQKEITQLKLRELTERNPNEISMHDMFYCNSKQDT